MKVYVVYNAGNEEVEAVFKNTEDANNYCLRRENEEKERGYTYSDICYEEFEVK